MYYKLLTFNVLTSSISKTDSSLEVSNSLQADILWEKWEESSHFVVDGSEYCTLSGDESSHLSTWFVKRYVIYL